MVRLCPAAVLHDDDAMACVRMRSLRRSFIISKFRREADTDVDWRPAGRPTVGRGRSLLWPSA